MEYHMVGTTPSNQQGMPTEPGAINGGMTKRQDPVKTPVITIDVNDIDSTLKSIDKLGGKVVQKKQPVADMGFTAYFKDTEGNVVGLWQNAQPRR
jgi:predicted enzyme related to lactoylglutathione lyase